MLHFFREWQEASHATPGRRMYHWVSAAVLLGILVWTFVVHVPVWFFPVILVVDSVLYIFLIRKWIRDDLLSAYRAEHPAGPAKENGASTEVQRTSFGTSLQSVTGLSGPWFHLASASETELIRKAAAEEDILVIELDGSRMRTVGDLYAEYLRAFSFPEYFGSNWNAFHECLADLRWLPARKYLTIVSRSSQVLEDEGWELETYLRGLETAGKTWSTKVGLGYEWGHCDIPFHTILVS